MVRKLPNPIGTTVWYFDLKRCFELPNENFGPAQTNFVGLNSEEDDGKKEPETHQWTNTDGMKIEALFHGLEPDGVKLQMRDGRHCVYPLSKLDAESQALVDRLGK